MSLTCICPWYVGACSDRWWDLFMSILALLSSLTAYLHLVHTYEDSLIQKGKKKRERERERERENKKKQLVPYSIQPSQVNNVTNDSVTIWN